MREEPLGLYLRAAVLGRPVGHSLSPVLHTAAYAALGLTGWRYEAIDCGAEDLAPLVAAAGPEWAGYSVTMPGKRAALAAADAVADTAARVGAANTLVPGPGGWTAHNTDVRGVTAALGPVRPAARVVLLGAGGTAQAAVVALAGLGVRTVDVLVRDVARAADLSATASRVEVALRFGPFEASTPALTEAEVVVSTVPAGAADLLADAPWLAGVRLLDAIYAPWPTALAAAVVTAGGTAVGGREILLHQAGEQVRLMTGRDAPLAAMRTALEAVRGA